MEMRQILLVGLGTEGQKVRQALADMEITILEADAGTMALTVGQIFTQGESCCGETMSPAVIMFRGFDRDSLDPVLLAIRQAGLSHQPLKAMVTPTNWNWRLGDLYSELQQEQQVMGALMKLKKLRDAMPMPDIMDIPAMKARMQAEVLLKGGEDATLEAIEKAYGELKKFM